ncbi:unnamed protein product [Brugia pahangi]|uniref:Uncharacterized protein n=1 Tax=Brugia pahangi TaxID=6280 RepID=A0A0N4TIN5_BRUPA|nr:unnamed protein product [Brugia pahangi]
MEAKIKQKSKAIVNRFYMYEGFSKLQKKTILQKRMVGKFAKINFSHISHWDKTSHTGIEAEYEEEINHNGSDKIGNTLKWSYFA